MQNSLSFANILKAIIFEFTRDRSYLKRNVIDKTLDSFK